MPNTLIAIDLSIAKVLWLDHMALKIKATRATVKCGRANNLVSYNFSLLNKRKGIKMSGGAEPSKKPKT